MVMVVPMILMLVHLLLLVMVRAVGRASIVEDIDGIPHVTRFQHDPQSPHRSGLNSFSYFFHQKDDDVDNTLVHEVVFKVHYSSVDELRHIVRRISDPKSSEFGNHLDYNSVNDIIDNTRGKEIVVDYLTRNNINIISYKNNGHRIRCNATLATWAKLFQTKFYEYEKTDVWHKLHKNIPSSNKLVRAKHYKLPKYVDDHIQGISNLVHLPAPMCGKAKPEPVNLVGVDMDKTEIHTRRLATLSGNMYPSLLYSSYGINGTVTEGNQSIYMSLGQYYSHLDISQFQSYFGITQTPVSSVVNGHSTISLCKNTEELTDCVEASLDIEYITAIGVGGSTSTRYKYDSSYNTNDFLEWLEDLTDSTYPALVHSISYAQYEYYVDDSTLDSFDTEALIFSARGGTLVAASGDDGAVGFLYPSSLVSSCGYYAFFPASSPYVIAVGSTMGLEASTAEIASSSLYGGGITSGGGFSHYYEAPDFQADYVNSYFDKVGSSIKSSTTVNYDKTKRAYPDVSMAGENYLTNIGGSYYKVDGTSASAPVFAGVVALINSYRLGKGYSAVGWMLPVLYTSGVSFYNDITVGNNNCTKSVSECCSTGFPCTTSWDPVTGFGSIKYQSLLSYYKTMYPGDVTYKPSVTPTRTPTAKPSTLKPTCKPSKVPTRYPSISFRPSPKPSKK